MAFVLVSNSPPAIITGDVQGIRNIELVGFVGHLCSVDVDRDGKEESFFVSETEGWRDEWIDGRWVAYEIETKRVNEICGTDTIRIASYTFSFRANEKPPSVFASVGFLDASRDGLMDMVIALWDEEGFSEMKIYDLSVLDKGQRPEITGLMPDLKWPSYEIRWPTVIVKSPYGRREYSWGDGEWVENE